MIAVELAPPDAEREDARRSASTPAPKTEPSDEASALGAKFTVVEIAVIVIAVVAAVALARFAEPFLVPMAAGILLSYTLRPLVSALERIRVPRAAGAGVVILALVGALSTTAYALREEVNGAIAELPNAARKLRQAVAEATRERGGPITHVKEAAVELDKAAAEATGKAPAAATAPPAGSNQVQTFIAQQSAKGFVVLTQLFIAFLLAFFLLAAGDAFRRKVAHLAGESLARRRVTVEALNEVDAQVQAYLLTLLVTNVLIALATWGALYWLGVPNAGMWGVVVGVLHIIPYAGTAIGAAIVGIAAFVDSANIATALAAIAIVTTIAAVIGMGLATWLQGRACRMNAVAAFAGVMFFGWLWGGWGLLLGMPLMAVLKSIADRVEGMHAVSEMLRA